MRVAQTTGTGRRRLRRAVDPVFVDRTGRRRRLAGFGAAVAAVMLVSAVVIMLAGFVGAGDAKLPGLPGLGGAQAPGVAPAAGQSALTHPTSRAPRPQSPAATGATAAPGGLASTAPSPSSTSRRTVPTQTPSHPGKKK